MPIFGKIHHLFWLGLEGKKLLFVVEKMILERFWPAVAVNFFYKLSFEVIIEAPRGDNVPGRLVASVGVL